MGFAPSRVVHDQDFRDTSTDKLLPLGTKGETADGRTYRYVQQNASTAAVAGMLYVQGDPAANHVNRVITSAVAVGGTEVVADLGATAAAADLYADGYMVAHDEAGEGIAYRIKGHAAVASDASITVQLAEPIKVALTTASEVSFLQNPGKLVVISATDQLDLPVGVANNVIATSAYGWLQSGGICAVNGGETFARGVSLTIGTGTAGEVEMLDAAGEPYVGNAYEAGIDGEAVLVDLGID